MVVGSVGRPHSLVIIKRAVGFDELAEKVGCGRGDGGGSLWLGGGGRWHGRLLAGKGEGRRLERGAEAVCLGVGGCGHAEESRWGVVEEGGEGCRRGSGDETEVLLG